CHLHHRHHNRVIAVRSQYGLLHFIAMTFDSLLEVPLAYHPVKGLAVPGVVGAECSVSVCQEADARSVEPLLRAIVVEKFRRSLILANLHISVVRYSRNQPVVSHLVGMVGGRAPFLMCGRYCLGVRNLVAGVLVCRQAKLVRDPLTKMTRAIDLRVIRCLSGRSANRALPKCFCNSRQAKPLCRPQSCDSDKRTSIHCHFSSPLHRAQPVPFKKKQPENTPCSSADNSTAHGWCGPRDEPSPPSFASSSLPSRAMLRGACRPTRLPWCPPPSRIPHRIRSPVSIPLPPPGFRPFSMRPPPLNARAGRSSPVARAP